MFLPRSCSQMMTKRKLSSGAPLPERGETTPNSVASTGKKLRKESSEEEVQELQNPVFFLSEQHKVTPRMGSELKDEVSVTESCKVRSESSQSYWIPSPEYMYGVQKESQSGKQLYSELVHCRDIHQGKSSITCTVNLRTGKIDKKEDEVNLKRGATLDKQNNMNLSNVSCNEVAKPNTSFVLPFKKVSPLWKPLEALKVFNHIPQMPHFRKLKSKCQEEREGQAIGLMVTYARLAECSQRLQIYTKVTDFEAKIACLNSLEENGFIVDPIRSHLQDLLALKNNDTKYALKRTELDTALAYKEQENTKARATANGYETELEDVRKKIEEFRKTLTELEEKEQAIMKGKANVLISAFEGEHIVSRLKEEISSIERSRALNLEEFERARSRPLT